MVLLSPNALLNHKRRFVFAIVAGVACRLQARHAGPIPRIQFPIATDLRWATISTVRQSRVGDPTAALNDATILVFGSRTYQAEPGNSLHPSWGFEDVVETPRSPTNCGCSRFLGVSCNPSERDLALRFQWESLKSNQSMCALVLPGQALNKAGSRAQLWRGAKQQGNALAIVFELVLDDQHQRRVSPDDKWPTKEMFGKTHQALKSVEPECVLERRHEANDGRGVDE